jgi:hypothetical protein
MHERLKEYLRQDAIYQDWKTGELKEISDFDEFCIQHCKDIEDLLIKDIYNTRKIKDAIDKLYHWGETLPPKFQEEMLGILEQEKQKSNE